MTTGVAGLLMLAGAYLTQAHAAQGLVVPPGDVVEVAGIAHVVGVASGGEDATSTSCTAVAGDGSQRAIAVGVRPDRSRSIPSGQRLPAGTVHVTCDQHFSVSGGAAVLAYPLNGSSALPMAYLAVTLIGFALVWCAMRSRPVRPVTGLAVEPSTPEGPMATTAAPPTSRLTAPAFLLAVLGTLAMLAFSAAGYGHRWAELPQNLLLLVVVAPATLGVAVSLRRQCSPSPR